QSCSGADTMGSCGRRATRIRTRRGVDARPCRGGIERAVEGPEPRHLLLVQTGRAAVTEEEGVERSRACRTARPLGAGDAHAPGPARGERRGGRFAGLGEALPRVEVRRVAQGGRKGDDVGGAIVYTEGTCRARVRALRVVPAGDPRWRARLGRQGSARPRQGREAGEEEARIAGGAGAPAANAGSPCGAGPRARTPPRPTPPSQPAATPPRPPP